MFSGRRRPSESHEAESSDRNTRPASPPPQPRSTVILYIVITQVPARPADDPTRGTHCRSAYVSRAEALRQARTSMTSQGIGLTAIETVSTDTQDVYFPKSSVVRQVRAWVEEVVLDTTPPQPVAGWEVAEQHQAQERRRGSGGARES
ncbi:hypothetical protein LTR56_009802 [Elasticomyces elasticus]|nr:hypothetical protein LTR56_009802 [Elasticomyces elasticus]KAK3653475.1 hypothetical protein LTR22_011149 [Elasticomyces elasticus]KAK4906921.1 hypothetical protein LTR49_024014 [Elasticomyces elasticus]KAK5746957.1 hypothetical protein LTS12_022578 [Elasticomyces elasticus]